MNVSRISRIWTAVVFTLFSFSAYAAFANTLYTMTNPAGPNSVVAFQQDSATGVLTLTAIYSTGGMGNPNVTGCSQDSIAKDGDFLYVVNAGSNDISVFHIEKNGVLKLVGSPVPSGGTAPVTIAVAGHVLYVANQGDLATIPANYSGFFVDDGHLSPIEGSTVQLNINSVPGDLRFTHEGKTLIGTRIGEDSIDVFQVTDTGVLQRTAELTGQFHPFGVAFSPVVPNQLIAALEELPGSASYRVTGAGELQAVAEASDAPADDPCWVQIRRDGRFVWFSGLLGQTIALHELRPDGTLQPLSLHSTAPFGRFTSDLILDSGQQFLYAVLPGAGGRVHAMRLTGGTENGGLSDVGTVALPLTLNSRPMGLVMAGTGQTDDDQTSENEE